MESQFNIKYYLHKDGSPVIDSFDTEEQMNEAITEKLKQKYNPIKIDSSEESIRFHFGLAIKKNNQTHKTNSKTLNNG